MRVLIRDGERVIEIDTQGPNAQMRDVVSEARQLADALGIVMRSETQKEQAAGDERWLAEIKRYRSRGRLGPDGPVMAGGPENYWPLESDAAQTAMRGAQRTAPVAVETPVTDPRFSEEVRRRLAERQDASPPDAATEVLPAVTGDDTTREFRAFGR